MHNILASFTVDTVYSSLCLDLSTLNPIYSLTLTTKRLVSQASKAKMLSGDGTHKVNGEKSTLLVVGTSDKSNQFHPMTLSLSSESQECYEPPVRILKTEGNSKPEHTMSDASERCITSYVFIYVFLYERINTIIIATWLQLI